LQIHLTLPELPPGTRAMLLSMSNFGGGGFKNIKSLQVGGNTALLNTLH
jgi:hypothetical protein